ncbi:hypothetical protein BI350_07565 [Sporosarcina ureilytica]|uniref:NERD domain-containing protein n=1 Tax=Sporosarcina ureilytica TaxID=298596 RepID=A0A1D8JKA7_9BACL|nr:hypothetical protein BI350_07565 [Sporosarcina ureilytica]
MFIINPLLLAFVFLTGVIFLNRNYSVIKGAAGERKVNQLLNRLGPNYTLFHDLYLPTEKGTTQVDHIVTSPYGIFVIETKHYNGWIFGNEHNKYWTQVIYKRKERMLNPIWQNYGHIQALKNFIGEEHDAYLHSIIAFSNASTLKFKDDFRSARVTQFMNLTKVLKEWDIHRLNEIQLQEINIKLEGLVMKDKKLQRKVRKQHVQDIQSNRKERVWNEKRLLKQNICPKCKVELVLRDGKYGSFYGCSSFPKCRFTKNA